MSIYQESGGKEEEIGIRGYRYVRVGYCCHIHLHYPTLASSTIRVTLFLNLNLLLYVIYIESHFCTISKCSLSFLAPLEAILFDLDGTVCHSDPIHYYAFREMLQQVTMYISPPFQDPLTIIQGSFHQSVDTHRE